MIKYLLQYNILAVISDKDRMLKLILAYDKQQCTNVFIIRWVLHNYKVIVVILLPVVSKRNKMLKYIFAYPSI